MVQIWITKSSCSSASGPASAGSDLALVAQRQRHLLQLVVEDRLGLAEDVAVGDRRHRRGDEHEQRHQRHQQAQADRAHRPEPGAVASMK
jgi:hypothetical protein